MTVHRVVCCENNHKFSVEGNGGEGYNHCPECNSLLKDVPADVSKGEPFTLLNLEHVFFNKREHKSSARSLSIDVLVNTDKMQLKLRAVAKHTTALADELDAIDNNVEALSSDVLAEIGCNLK